MRRACALCLSLLVLGLLDGNSWGQSTTRSSEPIEVDIVVYGGTSGGVVSAVSAARLGKSVVLIEPTGFHGGMTTGGLGATDIGNKRCIGGISREFYRRIFKHYQDSANWKQETREKYFKSPHRIFILGIDRTTFEIFFASLLFPIRWILVVLENPAIELS